MSVGTPFFPSPLQTTPHTLSQHPQLIFRVERNRSAIYAKNRKGRRELEGGLGEEARGFVFARFTLTLSGKSTDTAVRERGRGLLVRIYGGYLYAPQ